MPARTWNIVVNLRVDRRTGGPPGRWPDADELARRFGLSARAGARTGPPLGAGTVETLYRDFRLSVRPGEVLAVVGPSGAGKTALLRAVASAEPEALLLDGSALSRCRLPAVAAMDAVPCLRSGRHRRPRGRRPGAHSAATLPARLEILSRCGLAEVPALLTPAWRLSGGQRFRLALAAGLWHATRSRRAGSGPRPKGQRLLLADEFAAGLDDATAVVLARQVGRLVRRYGLALVLSTPRTDLLAALRPDRVIVKPLGEPPVVRRFSGRAVRRACAPWTWPVRRGTIADYHALAGFHYLTGPPAAHKRVWVIRPPRARGGRERRLDSLLKPDVAAVLVVSPPVLTCQGRNVATGGRYLRAGRCGGTELLNAEVECISRVVVHPVYRSCGLAVRLVRHALRHAGARLVEALAVMGSLHPFFHRAGMTAYPLPPDRHAQRLFSAADAVGLSQTDLGAVDAVSRLLASRGPEAAFFRRELGLFIRRAIGPQAGPTGGRIPPALLEQACRRATLRPLYYLARARPSARAAG